MYKRIEECLRENSHFPIRGKILCISGIKNLYPLIDMNNAELIETEYPKVDMQDLPYNDNYFDFVISDQVIEHLEDPGKAIGESYRVLKSGGLALHTTCFINYFHASPKDFWRFSPDALRYLCRNFSEIFQSEGWGNRIALVLCFLHDRFRFMNIPESKWSIRHLIATYNEKSYPIVTWVLGRK